jgi:23S rRNA (guanosine2251-2'-O)-methyltransferase
MGDSMWTVGFHAVLGVLEGEQPIEALWIQKDRRDQRIQEIRNLARDRGVRYDMVPRARLDGVADGVAHNGCAVRCAPVAFVDLGDLIGPNDEPSKLLLVDDLVDPHNLGAVLRTAAAFAIDGVVIAGPSAPPLAGATAKAAAGLLGRVPLVRERVGADALSSLRNRGYWVFAADAEGTPLAAVGRSKRWVLCIGSEDHGLRAKTRSQVDEFVAIPMAEGVESLNLSVSAGILLWELSKPEEGRNN